MNPLIQVYEAAMVAKNEAEANWLLTKAIDLHHDAKPDRPLNHVEAIERENIAYFAGYYDNETRARVERLFKCAHPVFGAIAENGPPSPELAFAKGQVMGLEGRVKNLAEENARLRDENRALRERLRAYGEG